MAKFEKFMDSRVDAEGEGLVIDSDTRHRGVDEEENPR
jgi:hypothetical protein